jgi:hypothetical protein
VRRGLRLGLAVAAVTLVASCAPRLARPPEVGFETRAHRYQSRLEERRARGVAMSAALTMWAEHGGDALPGARADLQVAGPDRMRLRVASPFGTALDLGFAGDSLQAYVPAWKTGLRLDAAAESLGVANPGDRVVRALCATWDPPPEAWDRAAWEDSLLRVAWADGEDSLAMAVGAAGLPAWVELSGAGRSALRASYRAWDSSSGVAWPALTELKDESGSFRLVWRATLVRFRPRPDLERLAVRWPRDASRLTLAELRRVFDRLGGL